MEVDACYLLGHVVKTHGLKGEVSLFLDVDDPEQYNKLDSVWLEDQGSTMVPYFVESLMIETKKVTAKFEDIDDIASASNLVGKKLYLPLSTLPKLEGEAFYYHEINGYQVIDRALGALGVVAHIYEGTKQSLIGMTYQGKEVLIPVTKSILLGVDREKREISVSLPDGLLEIYMEK